jgi:hypothetical protein
MPQPMPIAVMTWLIAVQRAVPCALPAKFQSMLPLLQATIDIATRTTSVSGTVHFSNVRIA